MSHVSLNVVTYNEASRIAATLADARPYVADIVVVDQSSDDGTADIAAAFADSIVSDVHHGFAEASRELAASRARCEWILVLDADERMTDDLKQHLDALIAADVDGYRLVRTFYLDGKHEFTGDSHYRLFKKHKVRFLREIHTEPQPVTSNLGATPPWPAIYHAKTWHEQIEDELRYERLILESGRSSDWKREKLALNVHLPLERARAAGASSGSPS